MPLPRTKLIEKVEAAEGTMSFHFEKPAGFEYKAGQFADYTLVVPSETDDEGNTRGFTLHNNTKRPAVFLTGGIGATPIRSIVLQSNHDKTGHTIFAFYSNKRPEDAAFTDEFLGAADANENFTFVPTMTESENSEKEWDGETGLIDKDMIARYIDDLTAPIYYLSGPAGMVTAMRTLLNGAGIDDDDIRSEEFTGY